MTLLFFFAYNHISYISNATVLEPVAMHALMQNSDNSRSSTIPHALQGVSKKFTVGKCLLMPKALNAFNKIL